MVSKPAASVGAILLIVGIAMTAVIMVIEEWVVVGVPGGEGDPTGVEAACEEEPLGSLGLYTATYNPACTAGKAPPGEDAYSFNQFEKEESATTEFWPLFPAQTGFANFFSADTPAFTDCEKYFDAATGPAIKVAEEYVDAAIVGPAFDSVDAGLTLAAAALNDQVSPILGIIDRLIPTLFGGSAGDVLEGLTNQSKALVDGLTELEGGLAPLVTGLNFSEAGATLITTTTISSPAFGFIENDVGVQAQLFDTDNWNLTRFVAFSECADLDAANTPGSPAMEGCIAASIATEAVLKRAAEVGTLLGTMGGLYANGLAFVFSVPGQLFPVAFDPAGGCDASTVSPIECAGVHDISSATLASDFSLYAAFVERALMLQFLAAFQDPETAGLFTVTAAGPPTLIDVNVNATALGAIPSLLAARSVFGVCSPETSFAACLNPATGVEGLNGLPSDLNSTWTFCLLAEQSLLEGLVDKTPYDGTCNVLAALTGLAAGLENGQVSLEGAGDAVEAALDASLPLIPLLLTQFQECAFTGVEWNQEYKNATAPNYPVNLTALDNCQASFMNPGIFSDPQTTYDQQIIAPVGPGTWTTVRYGLCFGVQRDVLTRTGTIPPCETFQDFVQLAAVEGVATPDGSFAPFVTFYGLLVRSCEGIAQLSGSNAVLGSPFCEQTLVAASGEDALRFALAALKNFYPDIDEAATNTSELVALCKDDEEDARRIGLAQVLVPASLGLQVVSLILALVTIKTAKKPLAIAAGVAGLIGCALVLAALLLVQTAPVYDAVSEDCKDFEACYQSGLARTLGLIAIATPFLGGAVLIGSSCCGGSEEEESKVATSSY